MDYFINLETLKQKNSDFQNLNTEVTTLKSSFESSYINTTSSSEISSVTNKIKNSINRLATAFVNCGQWFQGYCQDLEALESSLASFSNPNITAIVDFKSEFINIFSKITIPTLQTNGDKFALYNATKESLQNTTIFDNIPDNLSNNKVPYFTQNDPRWCDIAFGDENIGVGGCSITSISMVLSYLYNKEITPVDVRQAIMDNNNGNYKAFHVPNVGADWKIFSNVANYYNVKCEEISKDSVMQALQSGNPVIMSAGPGSYKDFTKRGHFIVLSGATPSGKITVNDPNAKHKEYSYQEWDLDRVLNQAKGFWEYSK